MYVKLNEVIGSVKDRPTAISALRKLVIDNVCFIYNIKRLLKAHLNLIIKDKLLSYKLKRFSKMFNRRKCIRKAFSKTIFMEKVIERARELNMTYVFKIKKKSNKQIIYLKKKKLKLVKQLTTVLSKKVEVKLNNFLRSSKTPRKFKIAYALIKKNLYRHKFNFFNKQFKEIYAALSISFFLTKAKPIVQLFSVVIGYGKFRNMKKNMRYMFNLIRYFSNVYSFKRCVKLNIYGKFKGKAKRTQIKFVKTSGDWNIKSYNSGLSDFHVGYVGTGTGVFGIKLWLN
jgi:hypothetical protein